MRIIGDDLLQDPLPIERAAAEPEIESALLVASFNQLVLATLFEFDAAQLCIDWKISRGNSDEATLTFAIRTENPAMPSAIDLEPQFIARLFRLGNHEIAPPALRALVAASGSDRPGRTRGARKLNWQLLFDFCLLHSAFYIRAQKQKRRPIERRSS